MKKLTVGLCLAVLLLGSFASTAEAWGRRCKSCNHSHGIFQGRHHGSTTTNDVPCIGDSCVKGVAVTERITTPTGNNTSQLPVTISQDPILVRGQDGRLYYLVPEGQYQKQK